MIVWAECAGDACLSDVKVFSTFESVIAYWRSEYSPPEDVLKGLLESAHDMLHGTSSAASLGLYVTTKESGILHLSAAPVWVDRWYDDGNYKE